MDRRAALLGLILLGVALAAKPAAGAGPTYVEGSVEGVWTPEGSPYVLVGNATVEAGRSLVVEAGVEVRAEHFTGLEILGSLEVRGSADAIVRFTANATQPEFGFWRGIHASGGASVWLSAATIEFAQMGVAAEASSLVVEDVSIAHSAEIGITARDATISVRRTLLVGNTFGLSLTNSRALVENTTFLGPTLGDVSLDLGSYAQLRVCTREAPLKFTDEASRVDEEGLVAVNVTDAFGVPQAGTTVLIEDNATNRSQVLRATTDHGGRVPGVVVTQRTATKLGARDFNPFRITVGTAPAQAFADVRVEGKREVDLTIPKDLTPPTPIASAFLAVDEDVPLTFDATGSRDNDPDFTATGTFRWTFPDLGLEFTGITASIAFETPGLEQGVLTAIDAAGNEAYLSFAVQVRDVTRPVIQTFQVPPQGATGESLLFVAQASDNDPLFAQGAQYTWRFGRGATVIELDGPTVALAFHDAGEWTVSLTVRDPAGNEVTAQASVIVVAPPSPNPWPAVLGGGALFAAAAALATERGKAGLFALLLPLYTRLRDGDVLDQFTRGQIYGYIRVHPGDTYTDIKRNLGLNNGTLTYHLDVLAKQGYVRSVVRGARKMFFPVDVPPPEDGGGLAEIQRRLLGALVEAPGIAIADLAASLGISRQLALYHTRLLAGRGLVRLERRGLRLIGYPLRTRA
jgi:DNA-binding MarR family transcriptional regulator